MQTDAGGYWLDNKNPEYDQIQYYLKTCLLDRGVAQNLEVWKIENPEGNYKYERKTANMLKVACWTHSNSIEGCTLEDICTKGVRFDRNDLGGMEFKTGVIEFSSELALYTSYCLVYFEVAVGRSLVFDGDLKQKKLPPGYDSFYIPPTPLDRNHDGEFDLQEYQAAAHFDDRDPTKYRHRYFVKEPVQVCAKYVVRFDLAKKVPGGTIGFTATGAPRMIEGSEEDEDLSMFDPITLTAVSKKSLQSGGMLSPSGTGSVMGLNGAGPTSAVPIQQAFNQAMEDFYVKDKDPVMLSKKDWTGRQLNILEDKVREVNLNYAEISEAIAEAAAQAMAKLQTITRNKLETCLSMEIELRRESEQLAWLDAHIDAQMRDAQAAAINTTLTKGEQQRRKLDFIKSWKYYTIFRNSVSRAKPTELQALSSLHGDTKIHSDIQIFADPFYSGGASALSNGASSSAGQHGAAMDSHFPMQPYAVPAQPTEILVSASLQSLVDAEMEAIQRAVRAAVEGDGPPLPRTVERPLVGGERVSVPLHELLDGIAEEQMQLGDAYNVNNLLSHEGDQHPGMYGGYGGEYGMNGYPMGHQMPQPEDGVYNSDGAFARSLLATAGSPQGKHDMMGPPPDTPPSALGSVDQNQYSPLPGASAQQPAVYAQDRGFSAMSALFPTTAPAPAPRQSIIATAPQIPVSRKSIGPASPMATSAVTRKGSTAGPSSNVRRSVLNRDSASVASQDTRASRDAVPVNMNTKHQGKVIYMDKQQLLQFASSKEQFSLKEMSARKRKQMLAKNALTSDGDATVLAASSAILQPQEAENLYFSLPFFTKPPSLRLIYSTVLHYRSLEELLSRTFKHRGPCLLLIKSGEFSFGAYLTHQLAATCSWTGAPTCFLFSNTLGLKVPYHARTAAEVAKLGNLGNSADLTANSPLAYFVQPDAIFIGNGDLSIDGELLSGSSELENFYGCGIVPRSPEALCLLAGTPVFNIDEVEVWAVTV